MPTQIVILLMLVVGLLSGLGFGSTETRFGFSRIHALLGAIVGAVVALALMLWFR